MVVSVTHPTFLRPRKRVPGSSPNRLSIAASYSAEKNKPLLRTPQPEQEQSGMWPLLLKSNTLPHCLCWWGHSEPGKGTSRCHHSPDKLRIQATVLPRSSHWVAQKLSPLWFLPCNRGSSRQRPTFYHTGPALIFTSPLSGLPSFSHQSRRTHRPDSDHYSQSRARLLREATSRARSHAAFCHLHRWHAVYMGTQPYTPLPSTSFTALQVPFWHSCSSESQLGSLM